MESKKLEPWQERFIFEFNELTGRIKKLGRMIRAYEQGKLDFTLNCPIELLKRQYYTMIDYRNILKERSKLKISKSRQTDA